jgi:hypothetical protein
MDQLPNMIYLASVWAIPLVIAITFHEAAHGFVARFLGRLCNINVYLQSHCSIEPGLEESTTKRTIWSPSASVAFGRSQFLQRCAGVAGDSSEDSRNPWCP